jgi:hypothetical protein
MKYDLDIYDEEFLPEGEFIPEDEIEILSIEELGDEELIAEFVNLDEEDIDYLDFI